MLIQEVAAREILKYCPNTQAIRMITNKTAICVTSLLVFIGNGLTHWTLLSLCKCSYLTISLSVDDDLRGGLRLQVVRGEEDDREDVLAGSVQLNRVNQFRLPLSGKTGQLGRSQLGQNLHVVTPGIDFRTSTWTVALSGVGPWMS